MPPPNFGAEQVVRLRSMAFLFTRSYWQETIRRSRTRREDEEKKSTRERILEHRDEGGRRAALFSAAKALADVSLFVPRIQFLCKSNEPGFKTNYDNVQLASTDGVEPQNTDVKVARSLFHVENNVFVSWS
jgi:hypothetical protein